MNESERVAYRTLHERGESALTEKYGDGFTTVLLQKWEDERMIRIKNTSTGYVITTFKKYAA